MKRARIHYQCHNCSQVVGHIIFHLEKHHGYDSHELFMMEEKEPEKYKELIEANYTRTDQEVSSLGKKRVR